MRRHQRAQFEKARWFQSTHSLRSATSCAGRFFPPFDVSIHALLAECDVIKEHNLKKPDGFNPRTPCGVRLAVREGFSLPLMFQSTHSLRSATVPCSLKPPWMKVSIHALLAECDDFRVFGQRAVEVSIHALLAECDFAVRLQIIGTDSFNPRTPCGVRHLALFFINCKIKFQSTHSLRSATSVMAFLYH